MDESGRPLPSPRPPQIFLSYRREDSAGHAGRLYDRLVVQNGRESVFMDVDAIRPGRDFIRSVESAVIESDFFLAVIGRSWATCVDHDGNRRLDAADDLLRREIEIALTHPSVTVIPLLVQGAAMPGKEDLPDPIAGLRHLEAIEVSDKNWNRDVELLLEELSRWRPESASDERTDGPSARSAAGAGTRWRASRPLVLLCGMLALALSAALTVQLDLFGEAAAGELERAIPVGDEPIGIEEGRGFIWTANSGGTVSRVDPQTGAVTDIEVGGQPKDLKASEDAVWVWNYSDAVTRVDITTSAVDEPVRSPFGQVSGIALGGGYVWLTHGSGNSVSRLNTATLQFDRSPITLGSRVGGTAFANGRLYAIESGSRALVAIDGATGQILSDPLRLDRDLGGLQTHEGIIYVGSTGAVTPVDEATFVVGESLDLDGGGQFEVGGGSLWVSFPLRDEVRRFDLDTSAEQGEPIRGVGRGIGQTLFAAGALWVTQPDEDEVLRIQPH